MVPHCQQSCLWGIKPCMAAPGPGHIAPVVQDQGQVEVKEGLSGCITHVHLQVVAVGYVARHGPDPGLVRLGQQGSPYSAVVWGISAPDATLEDEQVAWAGRIPPGRT